MKLFKKIILIFSQALLIASTTLVLNACSVTASGNDGINLDNGPIHLYTPYYAEYSII